MSQELHYTSVARGLKPGSRGFGTVAVTANLPEILAERLEALSAYQAVYPPGDPAAALNPIAYVHVRLTVSGHVQDTLARIGPAGLDYSGRPNKYAHHVVLDPEERPEGGPAWLLSQPGFLRDAWHGEPRILGEGPAVPRGDCLPGVARAWQDLTGDAGWAGVLAESFLADARRPVFLVFRPGMELLPMFVEAIALLPVSRRWDVEFSTYFTTLPPGLSCAWRGVLEGSAQAKSARRLPSALILDLCGPLGHAPGGRLVHLARTGERMDADDSESVTTSRHGSSGPPALVAGPPPRLGTSAGARPPDARNDGDWLPDLVARLAADESLLGGDRIRRGRRPRATVGFLIAAALLAMVSASLYLSPGLRRQVGLEASSTAAAGRSPAPSPVGNGPRGIDADGREKAGPAPASVAGAERPGSVRPDAEKGAAPDRKAAAGERALVKADTTPGVVAKADVPGARPPAQPMLMVFTPPDVPRSSLGAPARQDRSIHLPVEAGDRIQILNGPEFRLDAAPATNSAWDVVTRTTSGLGGGFVLARLSRSDASTWRFEWTKNARAQSAPVHGLEDAILALRARDGRPIYVLLRNVVLNSDRPLVIWKDQRILFEKTDSRMRSVEWAGNSDALDATHWKPRIRRWKLVFSRPETPPGNDRPPRRAIVPAPAADGKAPGLALERELIPGEVKLKLAIDPESPASIDVRVEPDLDKVTLGRDRRSGRMSELEKATPADSNGHKRDPLEYRRVRLRKIQAEGTKDQEAVKTLQQEIEELERIKDIRDMEDWLTRPARVELSVVVGLDVEGPGILDIVRIGEFASGR